MSAVLPLFLSRLILCCGIRCVFWHSTDSPLSSPLYSFSQSACLSVCLSVRFWLSDGLVCVGVGVKMVMLLCCYLLAVVFLVMLLLFCAAKIFSSSAAIISLVTVKKNEKRLSWAVLSRNNLPSRDKQQRPGNIMWCQQNFYVSRKLWTVIIFNLCMIRP